ncbi:hypothetical protein [Halobacteriovorax sp. HLS]|uniref:hypothetical protein n=1 Tax=Halobacteriovorax sp. HLS TaxID=2234000 RepID=UPI000FD85809|nr:hypothetical protein [Halobacteriovorax sp. HLS]
MSNELINLAHELNKEMSELKIILAKMEHEIAHLEQSESFAPFIEQMKSKFDKISVDMFRYTQSDQIINVIAFINSRLEEIKKGTNFNFQFFGEEEFVINTSNQKLFTFFKVTILLALKIETKKIRIYHTKNTLLFKFDSQKDKILSTQELESDDQIAKLFLSIKKFANQCHLEFKMEKMISEKGHKMTLSR